ncbi:hypothetical protein ACX6XY_24140 [Streptomyces sp. O3]
MGTARDRLRSSTVVLGGMGLLAAALTACGSEPDKRCVDRDSYDRDLGYRVIDSQNCKTSASPKSSRDAAWYYGGRKKSGWAKGGSFRKRSKDSGSSSGAGGGTGSSSGTGSSNGGQYTSGGGSYDDDGGYGSSGSVTRGGFGKPGSGSSGG